MSLLCNDFKELHQPGVDTPGSRSDARRYTTERQRYTYRWGGNTTKIHGMLPVSSRMGLAPIWTVVAPLNDVVLPAVSMYCTNCEGTL